MTSTQLPRLRHACTPVLGAADNSCQFTAWGSPWSVRRRESACSCATNRGGVAGYGVAKELVEGERRSVLDSAGPREHANCFSAGLEERNCYARETKERRGAHKLFIQPTTPWCHQLLAKFLWNYFATFLGLLAFPKGYVGKADKPPR